MGSTQVGEHPHSGGPTHTGTSFAKALRRFKSMESHHHAGRVKEKPLSLSTNCIQTGRESMPTNGLLSSPKGIMSKPDVVKLCVQKSQGDHVRKLQFMNKKATTHAHVIH